MPDFDLDAALTAAACIPTCPRCGGRLHYCGRENDASDDRRMLVWGRCIPCSKFIGLDYQYSKVLRVRDGAEAVAEDDEQIGFTCPFCETGTRAWNLHNGQTGEHLSLGYVDPALIEPLGHVDPALIESLYLACECRSCQSELREIYVYKGYMPGEAENA